MKTNMKKLMVIAFASVVGASAHADDVTDWSILGPAWSKHMGTMAAVMHGVGSPTYVAGSDCSISSTGTKLALAPPAAALKSSGLPSMMCSASPDANLHSTREEVYHYECGPNTKVSWTISAPDDSWTQPGRALAANCHLVAAHYAARWDQVNPAFGIVRSVQHDDARDALFIGYARDSYGSPTLMAGVAHAWKVLEAGSIRADAGVTGGLWWRTEMRYVNTEAAFAAGTSDRFYGQYLVRRLEPVVLPALSMVESKTGLGLNVMYAPKLRIGSIVGNDTSTWMFQTTLVVKRTSATVTKVGLQPQAGGAAASLMTTF